MAVVVEAAFGGALVLAVFIGCRFRLPRDSGIKNAPRYLMPVPRTCSLFRRRTMFRHGDVFLEPTARIPAGAKKLPIQIVE